MNAIAVLQQIENESALAHANQSVDVTKVAGLVEEYEWIVYAFASLTQPTAVQTEVKVEA